MDEEAWKGPPPRPTILEAIGVCVEGLLSWQIGLGLGSAFLLFVVCLEATTPVCGLTVSGANKSKVVRAKGDLKHIADQVLLFGMEQKRLPNSMTELVNPPADAKDWPEGGYLERLPKDPWGGDYQMFLVADAPSAFVIISLGADNEPGGDDFDADLRFRGTVR